MSLTVLKLHVFLELHAVTPSPARLTFILSVAFYFLFPLYFPLFCPPLFNCFFCVCPLSNFLWFCHHVFVSMSSFLPHVSCLFGDKPRERDFLKTLRLVSGTEACAVEQHGETVDDDDKGVRVACPPPKKTQNPFNKLIQSVLWPLNRSVETIPLYDLSSCSLT